MRTTDVLVVYFSRTGTTRAIAEEIARELECEVDEIRELRPYRGLRGWVTAKVDRLLGRAAPLDSERRDPSFYDLVVLGTPLRAGRVAAPVRSYLEQNAERIRNLAVFVTHSGRGERRARAQVKRLCTGEPLSWLALTRKRVRQGNLPAATATFAGALRAAVASPVNVPAHPPAS